VSTLITPHQPGGALPDDDDPTGVRALLSGLPEPEPMPAYLVERIGASLAAEQAVRAETSSGTAVTPMLPTRRRRAGRLLFAMAGAAAAVALIGVVGNSLSSSNSTTSTDTAAGALAPSSREANGAQAPSAADKAAPEGFAAPSVQVRTSDIRYTAADFESQAKALRDDAFAPGQAMSGPSPSSGAIRAAGGLTGCLSALQVTRAQVVKADFALYDGQPAVIIVATTDGIPTAYAVGRGCSATDAELLHAATPLR